MHSATTNRLRHTFALTLLLAALAQPRLAGAQTSQEVEPGADFRTAPLIDDGTYRTQLVSGERIWVAVLYENRTELSVSARLIDTDVGSDGELGLLRSIIGPNLDLLRADTEDIGDGYKMRWGGGETETNLWFVAFTLETTGQAGVPHELEFTLSGFTDTASQEQCGDDCHLEEELADLEEQIAELEDELDRCGEECTDPPTREEREAERDSVQEDVDAELASIEELCGGEPCESLPEASTTPWLVVGVLGLVAAIAIGGLVRTVLDRRGEET